MRPGRIQSVAPTDIHRIERQPSPRVWRQPKGGSAHDRVRLGLEIGAGFLLTLFLVEGVLAVFAAPVALRYATAAVYGAFAIVLFGTGNALPRPLGWGNRVTLMRAALVITIAGLAAFPAFARDRPYVFIGLALAALALDGLDGWIARRTDSVSAFGARFDMELDAFFILVLCGVLVAIGKVGLFVVAIGMARYLFVVAQRVVTWLRAELPDSWRRKTVCVWQVATLVLCLLPALSSALASALVAAALMLLTLSFGIDTLWLYRRHRRVALGPRGTLQKTAEQP